VPDCNAKLKGNIIDLIDKMDDSIITNAPALIILGANVKDVHPLTFLTIAVSTPESKEKFKHILDTGILNRARRFAFFHSSKAGPTFTEKLQQAMPLEQYLDDFEQKTEIAKGSSRPFVSAANWEGLVDHLVAVASKKKKGLRGLFGGR